MNVSSSPRASRADNLFPLRPVNDRVGYRSDIEGLRAVAIMLVVAAHANITWLAGGYVGVDVFFVLSGYLITGQLVQTIRSTGSVGYADFYARRLKRLLPTLILVLICTFTFASLLLAPLEQSSQAPAAASAAVWLSNFYFAFSELDYFNPGPGTNLFLHTWSLSVEEQFYLVWPVFIALAFGAWADSRKPLNELRLKMAMLVIVILSLLACLALTASKPHLAFYMMPARAWQFALGALVFLHIGHRASTIEEDTGESWLIGASRWGGWIGLGLIFAAALALDHTTTYPGIWALLPSIGSALVLAAGVKSARHGVGRVLSLRPMQALGSISYAWYLWHWPVLLLGAVVISSENPLNRLSLVALSLILAALSFRFFEKPIRLAPFFVPRPRATLLLMAALMIFGNAMAIRWYNEARDVLLTAQAKYLQARLDTPTIYHMGCDDWYHSAEVRICAFGPSNAKYTALAIGDSVALQWFPAFAEIFNKPDWRLLVLTKSSCPMVEAPIFYARIGREYTECARWRQTALREVSTLKPNLVILGSTFTYDFTHQQWVDGTVRVLNQIHDAAERIYILRSTPVLPFDGPSCLVPRSWLHTALTGRSDCVAPAYNARSEDVFLWLKAAGDNFSNVSLIDMTDDICPNGQCRAELNGAIVFRDTQHLRAEFAKSLSGALGAKLVPPIP